MPSRITMTDVARRAGVSLMTVSRVVNQKGDVSPETRQRILDIIAELDYRPSGIARSLAKKETHTIGLVIPDVTNPFFGDITRGVERLAYAQGYHVFLCNSEEDPQRELAVIESLEEKRVDGLILCSSRVEEEQLVNLMRRLSAVVLVNRRLDLVENDLFEIVALDDENGGLMATQHLVQSGHRHIGFLAGPTTSYSGRLRKKGYSAAMEAIGLTPQPGWVVPCQPSVEGGYQAASDLLARHPELTAVFCYNDLVAVGTLQACAEVKRRVPSDLAVVGHDDIPLAALVSPPLTTCRAPCKELGARAVEALLERLKDPQERDRCTILPPELIVRQSAP